MFSIASSAASSSLAVGARLDTTRRRRVDMKGPQSTKDDESTSSSFSECATPAAQSLNIGFSGSSKPSARRSSTPNHGTTSSTSSEKRRTRSLASASTNSDSSSELQPTSFSMMGSLAASVAASVAAQVEHEKARSPSTTQRKTSTKPVRGDDSSQSSSSSGRSLASASTRRRPQSKLRDVNSASARSQSQWSLSFGMFSVAASAASAVTTQIEREEAFRRHSTGAAIPKQHRKWGSKTGKNPAKISLLTVDENGSMASERSGSSSTSSSARNPKSFGRVASKIAGRLLKSSNDRRAMFTRSASEATFSSESLTEGPGLTRTLSSDSLLSMPSLATMHAHDCMSETGTSLCESYREIASVISEDMDFTGLEDSSERSRTRLITRDDFYLPSSSPSMCADDPDVSEGTILDELKAPALSPSVYADKKNLRWGAPATAISHRTDRSTLVPSAPIRLGDSMNTTPSAPIRTRDSIRTSESIDSKSLDFPSVPIRSKDLDTPASHTSRRNVGAPVMPTR